MKKLLGILVVLVLLAAIGIGGAVYLSPPEATVPIEHTYVPNPTLAEPNPKWIPNVTVAETFGWIKTIAGQEKTKFRGSDRVGWAFTFSAAAYNLVRLLRIIVGTG